MWPFVKKEVSVETQTIRAHLEQVKVQAKDLNKLVQEFNTNDKLGRQNKSD